MLQSVVFYRMARFDGVTALTVLIGTALSPVVFNLGGASASYICSLALTAMAVMYLLFIVPEPIRKNEDEEATSKQVKASRETKEI